MARASPGVQHLDWFAESSSEYINKVDGAWACGTNATITDVETGLSFSAYRHGGTNHVDWEPETQDDTEILKSIYGDWSWERRPVHVLIGDKVFAGSMNGKPHGKCEVLDNGFPGHSCLHFLNSKTHGSKRVDKAHQAAVEVAYAASYLP